jgi:hypothetical protein
LTENGYPVITKFPAALPASGCIQKKETQECRFFEAAFLGFLFEKSNG